MEPQIQIGFSNNIYDNPADVVGSIRLMSNYFQAIEIELTGEAQPAVLEASPSDYDRIVDGLCQLAAERSLHYTVHASYYGPHTDLTSTDIEERCSSVDLLAKSLRFAADIQARIVTCHPGHHHGQDREELIDKLADSLDRVHELVSSEKITLCLENMGAYRPTQVVLTPQEQWRVCERTGAAVCLDIAHLASVFPEEQQLINALRMLAPLVQQVHLADTIRPAHRHIPIGKGDLPLETILSELKDAGYSGQAIVEEFNLGWTPEEYVLGALEFRNRARALSLAR